MNALGLRISLLALVAVGLSLAGCGGSDDTPPRRPRTAKTEHGDKTPGDKTAKTEGGETPVVTEGWGTLTGRFVVVGTVPEPGELVISQDKPYCDPFKASGDLRKETVIVSPKNELKNVVVYLARKPDRVHDDYKKAEAAEVVLDNHKCRFEPHIRPLRTTQTLRIKNSDTVGHNTKYDSFNSENVFNELIPAGSPGVTKRLPKEERYPTPYGCNVHPWMRGYLVLLSHPYMAVSGDDGNFEIKNLPAGELEFQFWHEVPGGLEIGDWKRGRTKIVIKPGEATDLGEIKVPAEKLKGA
jgi:hypothetical protein